MEAWGNRCLVLIVVASAGSCDNSQSVPAPLPQQIDAKALNADHESEELVVELFPPNLPDLAAVTNIVAELYNSSDKPNVPPFIVPREYWALLMESFGSPECEPGVTSLFPEMGSLRFEFVDGGISRLSWWMNPGGALGGPLRFAYLNVPCVRSGVYFPEYGEEAAYLDNLLRVIYRRVSGMDVGGDEAVFEGRELCSVVENPIIRDHCRENMSMGVRWPYQAVRAVYSR